MAEPRRAETFRFLQRDFDPVSGTLVLGYAFDDEAPLEETLVFPGARLPADPATRKALDRAIALLHAIAGVSYWKARLARRLDVGDLSIDAELAAFLDRTWTRGLGEFAFVNGLDLDGAVRFPVTAEAPPSPPSLGLPERALVAMGGGKDSLVSLEWLRQAGVPLQPVTVGASTLIGDTAEAAGLSLLRIERHLAPGLMAMNAEGAWNGHVPVTAINMAILACAALLYGHRWVVFSNERSADEPTLDSGSGEAVNHQYSKSLAFETGFRTAVRNHVAGDLEVFSLLRPLGEAAVTRRFSALTRYHPVFSSCNRNFHRDGSRIEGRWCGDCPKCRFTTLALAPWMTPEAVAAIVGGNLLDDPAQEEGFRALCALDRDKPFECVGTIDECRSLLATLSDRPGWSDAVLVRRLGPAVAGAESGLPELLAPGGPHHIPAALLEKLNWPSGQQNGEPAPPRATTSPSGDGGSTA